MNIRSHSELSQLYDTPPYDIPPIVEGNAAEAQRVAIILGSAFALFFIAIAFLIFLRLMNRRPKTSNSLPLAISPQKSCEDDGSTICEQDEHSFSIDSLHQKFVENAKSEKPIIPIPKLSMPKNIRLANEKQHCPTQDNVGLGFSFVKSPFWRYENINGAKTRKKKKQESTLPFHDLSRNSSWEVIPHDTSKFSPSPLADSPNQALPNPAVSGECSPPLYPKGGGRTFLVNTGISPQHLLPVYSAGGPPPGFGHVVSPPPIGHQLYEEPMPMSSTTAPGGL